MKSANSTRVDAHSSSLPFCFIFNRDSQIIVGFTFNNKSDKRFKVCTFTSQYCRTTSFGFTRTR
jgi:hypothetical protein